VAALLTAATEFRVKKHKEKTAKRKAKASEKKAEASKKRRTTTASSLDPIATAARGSVAVFGEPEADAEGLPHR